MSCTLVGKPIGCPPISSHITRYKETQQEGRKNVVDSLREKNTFRTSQRAKREGADSLESAPVFLSGKAALYRYAARPFQSRLCCRSKTLQTLPLNLTGITMPLRIEDSR